MIRVLRVLGVLLFVATALFWEPMTGVTLAAGSGIVVFESRAPELITNPVFLIDDTGQSVAFESITVTSGGEIHILMDPDDVTATMHIEVHPPGSASFMVSITL